LSFIELQTYTITRTSYLFKKYRFGFKKVVPLFVPHAENEHTDIDHEKVFLAETKAACDRGRAINVVDLQAFAVTTIARIPSRSRKASIGGSFCLCPQHLLSRGIDEAQ